MVVSQIGFAAPPRWRALRPGVPSNSFCPWCMTITWSEMLITRSMSCSISSTVTRPASDLIKRVDLGRLGRRHALRRLVEHQQLGLERHAERDLDPALVTMGEIADELVRLVVEPELGEDLTGARRGSRQTIQPDEIAAARCSRLWQASLTFSNTDRPKNRLVIWNERATPSRASL